jgi:hypothetical protein
MSLHDDEYYNKKYLKYKAKYQVLQRKYYEQMGGNKCLNIVDKVNGEMKKLGSKIEFDNDFNIKNNLLISDKEKQQLDDILKKLTNDGSCDNAPIWKAGVLKFREKYLANTKTPLNKSSSAPIAATPHNIQKSASASASSLHK